MQNTQHICHFENTVSKALQQLQSLLSLPVTTRAPATTAATSMEKKPKNLLEFYCWLNSCIIKCTRDNFLGAKKTVRSLLTQLRMRAKLMTTMNWRWFVGFANKMKNKMWLTQKKASIETILIWSQSKRNGDETTYRSFSGRNESYRIENVHDKAVCKLSWVIRTSSSVMWDINTYIILSVLKSNRYIAKRTSFPSYTSSIPLRPVLNAVNYHVFSFS